MLAGVGRQSTSLPARLTTAVGPGPVSSSAHAPTLRPSHSRCRKGRSRRALRVSSTTSWPRHCRSEARRRPRVPVPPAITTRGPLPRAAAGGEPVKAGGVLGEAARQRTAGGDAKPADRLPHLDALLEQGPSRLVVGVGESPRHPQGAARLRLLDNEPEPGTDFGNGEGGRGAPVPFYDELGVRHQEAGLPRRDRAVERHPGQRRVPLRPPARSASDPRRSPGPLPALPVTSVSTPMAARYSPRPTPARARPRRGRHVVRGCATRAGRPQPVPHQALATVIAGRTPSEVQRSSSNPPLPRAPGGQAPGCAPPPRRGARRAAGRRAGAGAHGGRGRSPVAVRAGPVPPPRADGPRRASAPGGR